jgi:chemotaxis protein methyltransferase CheR
MVFNETKRYYIERRVEDRILATGTSSFASYFSVLRSNAKSEIEHFINAFTVNETYFYREEHQLKCMTTDLLSQRLRTNARGESLRIWSVPCSTGEEPYSIAIWLLQNWPEVDAHNVEIVGSDIDTRALDAARAGLFGKRAFMRLPSEIVGKYFVPEEPEQWRILSDLRSSVGFTVTNITEPTQTRSNGKFDIIFCRNVLIYFDDTSRRVAAENLYDNLKPGGFICLGHTESMSRISPLFEVCRFADAIVYRRPLERSHG